MKYITKTVVFFIILSVFSLSFSSILAQQSEECVFGVKIDGESSISFPFHNQTGSNHAVPHASGGFIIFNDSSGTLTYSDTITYLNQEGDAASSRNNADGTFTTRTAGGPATTTDKLDVGIPGGSIQVYLDEQYPLNVLEWYQNRQQGNDEGDPSWASCDG